MMSDAQYQRVLKDVFGGDSEELSRRYVRTLEATIRQLQATNRDQREVISVTDGIVREQRRAITALVQIAQSLQTLAGINPDPRLETLARSIHKEEA